MGVVADIIFPYSVSCGQGHGSPLLPVSLCMLSFQWAGLRTSNYHFFMFILWQMIQESRFLIEMADTVQEKIVQCQKAGNPPTSAPFCLET